MRKRNMFAMAVAMVMVISLCGCKSRTKRARFADGTLGGKPVAERVATPDGGEMIVADITAFRDSVALPLSMFVENLEIIPLDSRNEALFDNGKVFISDNHIGIATTTPRSFKLFDRKGNYLRDIGHEGRGPGEYRMIYSAAIDEASETIYILPWQTDVLLAFGLDGEHKPTVRLAHNSPKGVFNINADGTFSFAVLPIGNRPVWAWIQDAEGNVSGEIPNPDPGRYLEYSSEIAAGRNAGGFDPFLTIYGNQSNDTLARYDAAAGRMQPLFTVKNIMSKNPPYYSYSQLPGYFIGDYAPGMERGEVDGGGHVSFTSQPPMNFIVDKQTLQGAFFDLVVDELGGLDVWPYFSQGYFIGNNTAISLKKQIKKLIDSGSVKDPAVLERITALNDSLDEDDNNVIFIGKLKSHEK